MFTKRTYLTLAVFTLTLATLINAQTPDPSAKQLQGAWKVIITPEDGGPPPFPVLFTFTKDGGVIEADQGPAAPGQPPSVFTPGLGEWQKVSKRTFVITYTQLQFDQAQNLIGTFRGRITAEVNADLTELTGDLRVDFFDDQDTLIFSGSGTVQGHRLPVMGAN